MKKIIQRLWKYHKCQKKGKYLGFFFLFFCTVSTICVLTGCQDKFGQKDQDSQQEKKIAILGKEAYVYSDEFFMNGLEMALQGDNQKQQLSWEHYDDHGEYDQGLVLAQRLAEDNNVVAVFSFQDFEVIDAILPYFEKAQKPLFALQGCYETTLEKGAEYFFSS